MNRIVGAGHKNRFVACASLPALLISVLAGLGVPSQSASSRYRTAGSPPSHAVKAHVRPVQWIVLRRLGGGSFRIGNQFGWCANPEGSGAPKIVGVRQIDRPTRVMLISYLSSGDASHCLGVEAQVERVVHIRGGLRGRKLFDGSKSPPVQRWPRPAG